MKLIIGIGNPGENHKNNRHNIGFLVVEKLQAEISKSKFLNPKQILIFKSQSFMNESGEFVKKLVDQYKIDLSSLWVIHDDLDIRLGEHKIQFGKGPRVHNGVNSVEEKLGSKDFWRVRMGIENRQVEPAFAEVIDPEDFDGELSRTAQTRRATAGKEYVLQDFTEEEVNILKPTIDKLLIDLINLISK